MYTSSLTFVDKSVTCLAIHCSDGRFTQHFNEFLEQHLHLPHCDRIIVPGGPAYLADYPETEPDGISLLSQILFMVEAHQLQRIILFMHDDCGCYAHQLGVPRESQAPAQQTDAQRAAEVLREHCPGVEIESYLATIEGNTVVFTDM